MGPGLPATCALACMQADGRLRPKCCAPAVCHCAADPQTLTQVTLPRVYRNTKAEIDGEKAEGNLVSLNFDGWTGVPGTGCSAVEPHACSMAGSSVHCAALATLAVAATAAPRRQWELRWGCIKLHAASWSAGMRGESIIGITAVDANRVAHVLGLVDMSDERHTAENLKGAC